MVEGEWKAGEVGKPACLGGIIPSPGNPLLDATHEHHGYGVEARVSIGMRVHSENFDRLHGQAGLFLRLPGARRLHRFAHLDEAAGQRPAPGVGVAGTLDEQHAALRIGDESIDGQHGCGWYRHGGSSRANGTPSPTDGVGIRYARSKL